jgi:hypothetical protein
VKRGQRFKKTNVFLIPPAYTKTPHECKGLKGCFGRGFFEGLCKSKYLFLLLFDLVLLLVPDANLLVLDA